MKKITLPLFLSLVCQIVIAQTQVSNLLCENLVNPIGLDVAEPRFSWQLASDKRDVMQTAYEIKVMAGKKTVWNSGKVDSDSSVHVAYKGSSFQPGEKYFWQVKVWDNSGKASSWSKPAFFQTGLLNADNWKGKWIQVGFTEDSVNRPSPLFRKEFHTSKKIRSAVAYITAHGMYEACINGKKVGNAYLTPGWTSYTNRLQYQAFDVTDLLSQGNNAIGVTLGNGWYRGYLAWGGNKDVWGKDLGLLLQLDITYSDGSRQSVVSDNSWKSSTGKYH